MWTRVVAYFKKMSGRLEKTREYRIDLSYPNKYLAGIQIRCEANTDQLSSISRGSLLQPQRQDAPCRGYFNISSKT